MVMVLMMHKKGHMLKLKYRLTTEELKCMGFMFVYNAELIVIAKEDETIDDVKYRQQQGIL